MLGTFTLIESKIRAIQAYFTFQAVLKCNKPVSCIKKNKLSCINYEKKPIFLYETMNIVFLS